MPEAAFGYESSFHSYSQAGLNLYKLCEPCRERDDIVKNPESGEVGRLPAFVDARLIHENNRTLEGKRVRQCDGFMRERLRAFVLLV